MQIIEELTGQRPLGWYTGRDSPNTRRLVADDGGLAYDSDYYGDDLPFWTTVQTHRWPERAPPHRALHAGRATTCALPCPGLCPRRRRSSTYLKDTFDLLYAEGDPDGDNAPKMMSVGMHCRLLGRPGRFRAFQRFLDHVARHEHVWVCRRIDIARHWQAVHPF